MQITLEITCIKKSNQNITSLQCEEYRLTATVLIEGKAIKATVDTGATSCFIKREFAEKIKKRFTYSRHEANVILADGTTVNITRSTVLPVTFGNQSSDVTFLIMPQFKENIILGLEFLKQFHTTIHCAGISVKLSKPTTSTEHCTVAIGEETPSKEVIDTMTATNNVSPRPKFLNDELSKTQCEIVENFLAQELPKFQQLNGLSSIAEHKIVMTDDRPIKLRYAPRNPAMQAVINAEVRKLEERGCIEPSTSPYCFPITLVRKKNGNWRTCMDFRQLNKRSVPDAYPLPRIDTILNRLRDAKYVSSLDLKDGYWQIPMAKESRKYTAFAVAGKGLYQWKVMPFGLHSAPATFQRALDSVIGPEMDPHAFAYLDDIIVIGKTFEEHLRNLREVFRRLRSANLRINIEKCEFFRKETKYLGHVVSSEGIKTDPDKVAAIVEMKPPTSVKEVRRFLGVASWYRRFVPQFATISQPLTSLLKKGKHWKWGPEQQEAFSDLKAKLTEAPVLACPDFTKTFILQTDASNYGLGAVLTQELDNVERVIAYASRHLKQAEKNYSATEKECLAILWGIRHMRPYLEGYQFIVITDHLALKWLNSIESPTGRLARWALELQQYNFLIRYRRGKQNVVADALSRTPLETLDLATVKYDTSPCPWLEKLKETITKNPKKYPDYTIIEGNVYRHFPKQINDEDCTPWKLCVPTGSRIQVLRENHDSVTGGHLGVRKTSNKVANRYFWPGMFQDIKRYVQQCECCQKYKVSQQKPAGEMLIRIPEEPWATICADFVGPLPRSKHGNSMLLVIMDRFSKWTELVPLRKATTEGLIKACRERIISRYGVPKILITDNGTQFTSNQFEKFLAEMGIKHQLTAPYTPQENPTERTNRTVKTMIAQVSKQHNTWDDMLPEIMLAINTSASESTGYSPAYLTQGREPRLPQALYDQLTTGTGARIVLPEDRAQELKEIFKIVRRNLAKASQNQRRQYNLRRRVWKPKIGEQVLVRLHPQSKAVENFAAKLAPKYGGPFVVQKFQSPVIVVVRGKDNITRVAHLSEIKPFYEEQN